MRRRAPPVALWRQAPWGELVVPELEDCGQHGAVHGGTLELHAEVGEDFKFSWAVQGVAACWNTLGRIRKSLPYQLHGDLPVW